jgi:hypothetical protein
MCWCSTEFKASLHLHCMHRQLFESQAVSRICTHSYANLHDKHCSLEDDSDKNMKLKIKYCPMHSRRDKKVAF